MAEWFPQKERALATGIFNAGSNVGAILTPLIVPWITIHYGWRAAFLVTGSLGFVWLVFWLLLYRKPEEHPRLSPAEFEYIVSNSAQDQVGQTARVPPNLGVRGRQIRDRSDLVVPVVLDP